MQASPRWILATLAFAALGGAAGNAAALVRCEVDGKPVNTDNGNETAGLTGLVRCREDSTGHLQREQEYRNGRAMGLERFFDRAGRLQRERQVNERGNSQGRVAEFWPNGQLKREEFAENGRTQGVVRRFSEQGRPERVTFYGEGRELAYIEYTRQGQPARLFCHASSVLAEDRKPCGHEGVADTTLFNEDGSRAALVRYDQGRLLAQTEWTREGQLTTERLFVDGRRTLRSSGSEGGKAQLREERVWAPDAERGLRDSRGPLASLRRWGASGQITEQRSYAADGREAATERWYLNGAVRERSTLTGQGAETRLRRELFDDSGRLVQRQQLTADQAPTGVQQAYYANGRLAEEEEFSAPDARGRTRVVARKQWDEDGRLLADDTILEDGSRMRRAPGGAPGGTSS